LGLAGMAEESPCLTDIGEQANGARQVSTQALLAALYIETFAKAPFCPISVLGSNFNPRNTQCIPVVKIFACLKLEQN